MIVLWSMYLHVQLILILQVFYLGVPGVSMEKLFEVMHKLALYRQQYEHMHV